MIKDTVFKALSIPILGVFIPLLSNLIRYQHLGWQNIIVSNVLFIATSYIIWQGSVFIVSKTRRHYVVRQKPFLKMMMLCLSTATYAFIVSSTAAIGWQAGFLSSMETKPVFLCGIICAVVVIFLTLMYEVLFLSKERELDVKIVDQLDKARLQAELNTLKNELDPHFVFNSLTTLSHLISVDGERAQMFTYKLAQVYKYLLINKDRELISLNDEINFIEDYFFLLRIRYDDKLHLHFHISTYTEKIMILPCSLQLLIENAIKHNLFTDKNPLHISISLNGDYLVVENNIKLKHYSIESTKIGLNNLSNRYRLLYQQNILIDKEEERFVVKLPLIKQSGI